MNKYFSKNTVGRDFVVGDIHGCFGLFNDKLKEIEFDKSIDRMFSVGDLIERGEDSMSCLKLLKAHWFHAVRGNHEDMMINTILHDENPALWLQNGGDWYFTTGFDELVDLAKLARELPYKITINNKIGICHAQPSSLNWDVPLYPKDKQILLWGRDWIADKQRENVLGVDKVYCGHTPVKEVTRIGNVNFIDTGAVFVGNLTVIEL